MLLDMKALFTGFWIDESATTRTVLALIPEGSGLSSRSEVAHRSGDRVADRLRGGDDLSTRSRSGTVAWAPAPTPATMREIVASYEKQSAAIALRG